MTFQRYKVFKIQSHRVLKGSSAGLFLLNQSH